MSDLNDLARRIVIRAFEDSSAFEELVQLAESVFAAAEKDVRNKIHLRTDAFADKTLQKAESAVCGAMEPDVGA